MTLSCQRTSGSLEMSQSEPGRAAATAVNVPASGESFPPRKRTVCAYSTPGGSAGDERTAQSITQPTSNASSTSTICGELAP